MKSSALAFSLTQASPILRASGTPCSISAHRDANALRRTSFTARPFRRAWAAGRRPASTRCDPTSQMPGNVEDLPAERIPSDPSAVPEYWSRPGVYGVYSADMELQYVAAVENVGEAIATHIRVINDPQKVFAVRMLTVDTVDSAPLGVIAENWVMAHYEYGPGVPPGNGDAEPSWRVEDEWVPDVYFAAETEPEMVSSEIKRVLRQNKVVLFMKGTRAAPKCGFSKATVEILDEMLGQAFVCVDCLDEIRNRGLREEIKRFSKWPTIPQLYVEGEFVGGADIVKEMRDTGELGAILTPVIMAQ